MNVSLWIIAALLALLFLVGAATKLFVPKEKLATICGGGWTGEVSVGFVKALGALEVLAAVGLVLPAAVDIAPVLVPLAAVGVVLLMIGAMITHLRRDEAMFAVGNLAYLAMAAFVAWGRLGPESPGDQC